MIGSIYEERRIWARAAQYYQLATERYETGAELYYRLARCRAVMGQKGQAKTALEQARAFCPPDDPLLLLIDRASTGSIWSRLFRLFWKR
jgi:tetratricopeptide (TPR) repeat protein